MADRFPSLDDIDAGQTDVRGGDDLLDGGADDAGDFLSRERAALGDDADQFSTPNDVPSVSIQNGDDDLLGGGDSDVSQFQSSFPAINSGNDRVAPGGTITGSGAPFLPGIQSSTSRSITPSPYAEDEAESDVVREWRERRDLAIQHREDAAVARKQETVKAAQEAVDEFYENYNNKKDKSIAQTKKDAEEFLAKREDTTAGGTSWERIAKLVDVKGKGAGAAGKERFRELLGSLVKDENAPGAKGY